MSRRAASRAGPCVQDDLDAADVQFEDALSSEGQGLFWVSLLVSAHRHSFPGSRIYADRLGQSPCWHDGGSGWIPGSDDGIQAGNQRERCVQGGRR